MLEKWLDITRQIQAIAHTGLTYGEGEYDLERYQQLRDLSLEMFAILSEQSLDELSGFMKVEKGYATPKVDVRAVVIHENSLLLVQEKTDSLWALPGGWADIGYSPSEIAVKEVREEASVEVKPKRLLGIMDKKYHEHPPFEYYTYKIFLLCEWVGGEPKPGLETLNAGFFPVDQLPLLSVERNTASQIAEVVARAEDRSLAPWFD